MTLVKAKKSDYKLIKKLYKSSFPKNEQKPFAIIKKQIKKGHGELFSIVDDNNFYGFVFTVLYMDIVLIDYLAINESSRGQGIGSITLSQLREKYEGKRIFLEIEKTEENAPNNVERIKRKKFYLKNGLKETGIYISIYSNHMEILTFNEKVNLKEYCDMLRATLGVTIYRILSPKEL